MPKIVDHDRRRHEIAGAAGRIIAERGIDAVTMGAIAEAAGVTTGAVTHYFADKDQVISAALHWADGAMQARAARAFENNEDVVSLILAVLPSDEASRIEWLVWAVFADRATRSKSLAAKLHEHERAWHELAIGVLQRMQAEGAIDPCIDIHIEAKLAVALIDGIGFDAAFAPRAWPEEEQRRVLTQYVDRLAPRPNR